MHFLCSMSLECLLYIVQRKINKIQIYILVSGDSFFMFKWKPPSLNDLTPYFISLGLTHLVSEASKSNTKIC